MSNKMIDRKTWDDFRATGLLFFINQILHAFGWAIVVQTNDSEEVINCYPARVKFRGFSEKAQDEEHVKIANYLNNHSSELKNDVEL
jgi:hypothetical protein